ncbi:gas vesicle protein [Streptomyces cellostaticus]|uniref:Gas vesicle protein n=1 Tax=Streptomyces cellostaticus TaxID=67285 RepID=A0A117PY81_9ACTN|nr:GvpL/GvpF family gas vesicle protein [Streptomyces cellostaticus]KUM98601.1 gas vesicle protein [Streptomyces cellostaticus]GHI02979.1 gas vesicle protein [Streptomyces cellostaticus]
MTGLRYVYAVCRPLGAPLQAQLTGVGGAPPALLHHHGLVAVVSTVPEGDFCEEALRARLADHDWLAATARAHQGVIDALTTVTTPLPLRPATVFRDDSGVRTMIEAREDDFRHTLDRLEGRVEWGVRAYAESERADETYARTLHERLSRHAEEVRLYPPQPPHSEAPGRNVLDAAYLVSRAESEEFVELVDRTKGESPGIRVELTGPWAAYSFTGEFTREDR